MKTAILLTANVFVIVVASLLLTDRSGAEPAIRPWQVETRPCRVLLDWRSDDRKNPAEATEVFLDTARLASSTNSGDLTPESFTFVAEKSDGSFEQMPFATRQDADSSGHAGTVFRFVPPPLAKKLWMYFGGADHAGGSLETNWNLLAGCFDSIDSWKVSNPRLAVTSVDVQGAKAMHLVYDDKGEPPGPNLHVSISRSFAVPADCRGVEAKVAFDFKANCENHVPFAILLKQFDQSGKELDACAVDPRWLAMCLASGEDIHLRQQGFIYPQTTSITLVFQVWCSQRRMQLANPDGSWMKYPESDNFQMDITRAELRAAQPIPFPGFDQANYAPGITGDANDLSVVFGQGSGFYFDANPRSVWSEGALPSDPRAYAWPCGAGTLECWLMPQWDKLDAGKRYVVNAIGGFGADHSVLEIYYVPGRREFHVIRRDLDDHESEQIVPADLLPGKWHHLAYTWDPAANHQELFVDGQSVMSHAADPIETIDITNLGSAKRIPSRVWLGQSTMTNRWGDDSLHGRMDEVRISDGVRYSAPFEPQRAAFAVDQNTRALFHFDGRTNGLVSDDRGYTDGALVSPMPPTAQTISFEHQGAPQAVEAQWSDPALSDSQNPLKLFPVEFFKALTPDEFTRSSMDRQATLELKPGQSATIHCDSQPHMDWVDVRCPDDGTALSRPFLARPGEVDPRTLQSLLATLKIDSLPSPRAKADAIFNFLVAHNDYFWSTAMDIHASGDITDPGQEATLYLNGYPQFGCGEQNRMVRDIFIAAGLSSNMFHGSQHVFEQVFFDGSWHIYDLFARMFFPARDNLHPAALSEVEADPYLNLRMNAPAFGSWLPSDTRIYQFPDREIALQDMGYQLRPGESLRYYWHNAGRYNPTLLGDTEHSKVWADGPKLRGKPLHWANHFPPGIGNGVFSFACTPRQDQPALSDWHDGSFVYRFNSPFVVCGATVSASSVAGQAPNVEISYDEGESWIPASAAADNGSIDLEQLCMARHMYWIRVTPPAGGTVAHFEHHAIVLMNSKVLTPVLAKGDNTLNFTADAGSKAQITVGYHEDSDAQLEIEGGARFGWLEGHPRQLLVCQPGNATTFRVKQNGSTPTVVAPPGVKTTVERGSENQWHVDLNIPATLADGLYPVTVKSDDRSRTIALLVAAHARLVTPELATKRGDATLASDPEGIRGQVLSLQPGAEVDYPLNGDGSGPVALFALAKIPEQPMTHATLALSSGPAAFIEPNYAHEFWVQQNLLHQWKWYHVRAGGYPWPTLAAVNLADADTAAINCTEGQTLLSDVLVLPAGNETLVESVTHYLFSGNYEPWEFEHDWKPVVTGVPYPLKK